MRVDLQRCFQIAVAHKVLCGLYIDAGIVEHRAIGVPQHLGSDVFDDRHARLILGFACRQWSSSASRLCPERSNRAYRPAF